MTNPNKAPPHATARDLKKVEAPRLNAILALLVEYGPQALRALQIIIPSIRHGDWKKAAADLMNTAWGRSSRAEANRLAAMLETGHHQPETGETAEG